MSLDIFTEKGQESVRQEQNAIFLFHDAYPDWKYIETPKNSPCAADGFLAKNNVLCGVVETKCRDMTIEQFDKFNLEWLVTMQKIIDCVKIAESLHVHLFGFLYLIPSKMLLIKKIWDNKEGFVVDFNVIKSETQATINGGTAIRSNAYIKMNDATILEDKF